MTSTFEVVKDFAKQAVHAEAPRVTSPRHVVPISLGAAPALDSEPEAGRGASPQRRVGPHRWLIALGGFIALLIVAAYALAR